MGRDVRSLMKTLIREKEMGETGGGVTLEKGSPGEMTTLGVPLEGRGGRDLCIDLTHVRVFRNLHTFAQLLIDEVIEQCGFGTADIMVRRKVDPNLTPELAAAGLDWVMIYARLDAAESLPFDHRHFGNCMQTVFRALQTQRWGGVLFPDFFGVDKSGADETPPALLFPFHLREEEAETGRYFLVEYGRAGRFLRITIEDAGSSRLQLRHIPHRVADLTPRRSCLADVHLVAEQIHQGILRECVNYRSEFTEIPEHQRDLFNHLQKGGLPDLQALHFVWPTDEIQMLLIEKRDAADGLSRSLRILFKEIQLLDDPIVLSRLARGHVVEMVDGQFHVYFDVSRYGACLNVSFDERRSVFTLEQYLDRMPTLAASVEARRGSLKGVRLFLIHHTTSEVIGLIKAFQEAGCEALTTFFVKYGGIVPDAYLETILSLPPDFFRFYGLQRIESRYHLSGKFAFSRQFSPLTGLEEIDEAVFLNGADFLGAMRLAAGHLFLKEVMLARRNGERILLVEDGGYLAPLINRFCLEQRSVGEVFAHFRLAAPPGEEGGLFSEWMGAVFPGSVEHTRNGHDYDMEVMKEFGKLQFPVVSIAVSSLKRGPEARQCAVSILNAVENIFHRLGALLSKRNVLVLGSAGAIGGFLKRELLYRLDSGLLFGVDIAASADQNTKIVEVQNVEDLGRENLARIDTVIGVVGRSILRDEHQVEMILHGGSKAIYFISGSTKTVEFADLEIFLQGLRDAANPCLGEKPVQVGLLPLRDLQTGVLQGYRVNLTFPTDPEKDKALYLLGELMPINFLYYGIPGEIVDEVMAQLFTVSCGLVQRQRSAASKLPPRVMAIDRDIDADANPLP